MLALAKPNRVRDFQQEDWVASVAGFGGQDDLVIGSGLYSGKVQFLDVNQKETEEGEKDTVVEFVAHEEALTSITSLPSSSSSSTTNILTASKDFSVKCWGINTTDIHNLLTSEPKKNQKKPKEIPYTPNHLFTLQGHTASVEEVTVNEQGKIACTASFDKTLKLWDLEDSLSSSSSKSTERKTKRRKGENGNETTPVGGANVVVPTGTLVGHTQAVSSAVWLNAGKVASGSWDYSVKIWDVESCACVQTFEGNKAVTSLTASHASGMLGGMFVSGHCDPLIRVWDYREGKMEGKKALKSHSAWVSSVEWHPTSDFLFVSGSYDGSVKVWDVRSMLPMHTVAKLHKDKVLCVKWCGDKVCFVLFLFFFIFIFIYLYICFIFFCFIFFCFGILLILFFSFSLYFFFLFFFLDYYQWRSRSHSSCPLRRHLNNKKQNKKQIKTKKKTKERKQQKIFPNENYNLYHNIYVPSINSFPLFLSFFLSPPTLHITTALKKKIIIFDLYILLKKH